MIISSSENGRLIALWAYSGAIEAPASLSAENPPERGRRSQRPFLE
jgi:hypothetical protein